MIKIYLKNINVFKSFMTIVDYTTLVKLFIGNSKDSLQLIFPYIIV